MKDLIMDLLKRQLAPMTEKAWDEIFEQSEKVFKTNLSVRKFADVTGPKGLDTGGVTTGRINIPENQDTKELLYGIHQMQPLVEVRSSFSLDLWELDNVNRGAVDIDLDPLEKAARRIAEFEENTIYEGLKDTGINGLKNDTGHKPVNFPKDGKNMLHEIAESVSKLKGSSVEGPYSLVLDTKKWEMVSSFVNYYPLKLQIEEIIGGPVIHAQHLDGAFLVSIRGGDFKLTLGQDLSIGYETHNRNDVLLYFTEAFTFQILEPNALIYMK